VVARFEDRLWSELVEQHGALLAEPPARARPPARERRLVRRGPLAALGLALAAGVAALVIALGGHGGGSAYAVVPNADGTVTVTISELAGVEPANERLAELGLPVRAAAVEAGCPVSRRQLPFVHLPPDQTRALYEPIVGRDGVSLRVNPKAIPHGDTLLLSADEPRAGFVFMRGLVIEGAAPSCVAPVPGE
jgi:hypothetical protein